MHRSTLVSYCYLGRTPSASTVQLLTGGERADVREVEVLDRLKAASGPRYGLGTCQCRGYRTALRGLYRRPSAGGTVEQYESPTAHTTEQGGRDRHTVRRAVRRRLSEAACGCERLLARRAGILRLK